MEGYASAPCNKCNTILAMLCIHTTTSIILTNCKSFVNITSYLVNMLRITTRHKACKSEQRRMFIEFGWNVTFPKLRVPRAYKNKVQFCFFFIAIWTLQRFILYDIALFVAFQISDSKSEFQQGVPHSNMSQLRKERGLQHILFKGAKEGKTLTAI